MKYGEPLYIVGYKGRESSKCNGFKDFEDAVNYANDIFNNIGVVPYLEAVTVSKEFVDNVFGELEHG